MANEEPVNYFQPWLSDKEPRVPEGWGVDAFRGKSEGFFCEGCKGHIEYRQQYLYKYTPEGIIILHNKRDCVEGIII